ncbi:protein ESSENTIAL FOR POTEXVIRUS ACCUMULATION 1-like [Argentina anserina]|uniref:protein ESSENTIAL FOR POTEXVIRUS ACCUMULATION 1-like n=1 Tax=Argentina anserina TaxID=57926 RepID=UPI002176909A|nr:protein ESSENTIAL FOR POTEXVIRUS ACCUMULATION 1-like [Potentilla anserina]
MADGKLDLPNDLLSSKPSDQSWTSKVQVSKANDEEKVHMGSADELKDPAALDSGIPLSPQWLYAKPIDSKLEMRGPTSLGNSTDSNQKEVWRSDGSEDKKDWRRPATESENSRRWREEERETSLLGGRRDRRKTERRADNIPLREATDSRTLPTTDRWSDGRNEVRRDSKWSSRWGPEEKEKESRTEKRTDVEKDDVHSNIESQSLGANNRSAAERESDSRDKWRPRHRMEVQTGGLATYRAAPGFGIEKGRVEGSNLGFALGRGRSSGIGRSAGTILSALSGKSDSVPGKPRRSVDDFRYPRGKLLDIYRQRKPELSFDTMPEAMEESPPLTQVGFVKPLAFHAPDADEVAILSDIWKGKITSSGVVYNSFRKGRSTENVTGVGDSEAADGVLGNLPPTVAQETNTYQEAANADDYGTLWNYGSHRNMKNEKDVSHKESDNIGTEGKDFDGMPLSIPKSNGIFGDVGTGGSYDSANQLPACGSMKVKDSSSPNHPVSEDIEFANYSDVRSKLPDVSNTLYGLASSEQNDLRAKELEMDVHPEGLSYFYLDPQGVTQGPYQGLDIISWFEQGFFGTDLLVRLEDAPEGTPFIELGDFMPHLKSWDGNGSIINSSSNIEESGGLGGGSLPFTAAVSDSNYTFLGNDHQRPLWELDSYSAEHIQPRISEPEAPLQLHSRGQSFNDFVEQDEDIVFPGINGTTAYSTARSSGSIHDPMANSMNHLPPTNELTESGVPIQNDRLHPFGLLWSELESGQSKQSKLANMPSSKGGRGVPFSANPDPATTEMWSDHHRKNSVSDPNLYQEMLTPRQLSHMEQEPSHHDLAEQLMSQQIRQQQQQQLQQRNMLSSFAHMNDSVLDPMQSQNIIHHQQLANHSSADLEHLLALQRQAQLEQHQLQQQQQFHQQKLLQEQQQSQVQQVLFEQLLRGQMHDPTLRQPHVDPVRANNVIDQVLLEQQLLHELQQRSHHLPRHVDPTMAQLIQAKFGHTPQGHQTDLFELLSRAQHEQQSLEQQMHARQLPMGLRQRMEEERHIGSIWPAEESNQIFRTHASNHDHRGHSSGFNPLDFHQRQQRASHEEQLNNLERNLSLQDRLQQGFYEPGSLPFERSMSLPAGAPGMNLDVVNAMIRAQGLDMQDSIGRIPSGQISSGIPSHNAHHPHVPNQFHVSHLDAIEGHWPEKNDQLESDWMDARFQQLHINAERQKRDSEIKNSSQDQNLWMSDGINEENSKRLLMELLHKKSGNQRSESLNVMSNGMLPDKSLPSGQYSGSSSSNHLFNLHADQEAGLNNSFRVGSFGSNPGELPQEELASSVESNEKLMYRSNSGALADRESFLAGINATCQSLYTQSNMIPKSSIGKEPSELDGRKWGSKSEGINMARSFENQERMIEQSGLLTTNNFKERSKNLHSMNASSGVSGGNASFYIDKIGRSNSFVEETAKDRVPIPPKVQENILLRRPPVPSASASQEGLPEPTSDPVLRGKTSIAASDGARRDTVVSPVNQSSDVMASSKKEMHFRRTSSASDADVSEASFIDMLKSNAKKIPPMDAQTTAGFAESSEGGRSGKKKGKKGRQIDPSLLGFKVTSTRIMMGEIQRLDD